MSEQNRLGFGSLSPPDGGFDRLLIKLRQRQRRNNSMLVSSVAGVVFVLVGRMLPTGSGVDLDPVRKRLLAEPVVAFSVDGQPTAIARSIVKPGVRIYWLAENPAKPTIRRPYPIL
jgi:hypothetical protein